MTRKAVRLFPEFLLILSSTGPPASRLAAESEQTYPAPWDMLLAPAAIA